MIVFAASLLLLLLLWLRSALQEHYCFFFDVLSMNLVSMFLSTFVLSSYNDVFDDFKEPTMCLIFCQNCLCLRVFSLLSFKVLPVIEIMALTKSRLQCYQNLAKQKGERRSCSSKVIPSKAFLMSRKIKTLTSLLIPLARIMSS